MHAFDIGRYLLALDHWITVPGKQFPIGMISELLLLARGLLALHTVQSEFQWCVLGAFARGSGQGWGADG